MAQIEIISLLLYYSTCQKPATINLPHKHPAAKTTALSVAVWSEDMYETRLDLRRQRVRRKRVWTAQTRTGESTSDLDSARSIR